jgi:voltage-gated potassium channel
VITKHAQYGIVSFNPVGGVRRGRLRISVAVVVFFLFMVIATGGYYLIEGDLDWLDAAYMTIITVSTVGLGEVGDGLSGAGRAWTIFVIAGGLTSGAVALSLVVAALVEGRLRTVLGRRQLERRIAALSGHIVICGYGRMGHVVGQSLQGAGRSVVVVDSDPERTAQAEREGVAYLLGDAREEVTLQAAGIERAAALIAALPDDAGNVFLTLTARGLNPRLRIIARAEEAATQDKLVKAGASRVICPQTIGANRIVDVLLRPAMVDFVEMAHKGVDLEMDQLTVGPDSGIAGQTLRELSLPSRAGAMVVVVQRLDGTALYSPGPEVTVSSGDTLVLIGRRGLAGAIQKLQGPGEVRG